MGAENLVLPMAFGPYELLRLVAAGGMARVYEARLRGPHGFVKRLAVKMMLPEYAGDADFVAMLIDEAKIAVQLSHSNICQIMDLGLIDGSYYIAMEYVDGADLNRVVNRGLQEGLPMPVDVVARIGQEICAGLEYAHSKVDENGAPLKIVHRDISPANILISMSGEVKIVDFGVAKAASRSQHTTVGVVKGKYQYMSPEQVSGGSLDHRTDIFSTGIVLYESIAGRMMYPDGPDMLDRIRLASMRPLELVRPDVPPELAKVIGKALARRPQDRYQTAGELAIGLSGFLSAWKAEHASTRLPDLMERLFGGDEAPQPDEVVDAPESPPSRLELVERGGSLVRSPAFPAEARHYATAPLAEVDDDRPSDRITHVGYVASRPAAAGEEPSVEDTIESGAHAEPADAVDGGVDVDLTFLEGNEPRQGKGLYMVRDQTGRSSGPFGRAQLLELVLSGEISENDEVLAVGGAGAHDEEDTAQWMPASGHLPESGGAPGARMPQVTPSQTIELSVQSAARIFLDFAVAETSGVAVFDRPGAYKEVTVVHGRPVYASSNLPAELLGERLVRLGMLTRAGLGLGLKTATREGKLLGQALVDLQLVDPQVLSRSLEDLVRARLLELFLWRAGSASFFPGALRNAPLQVSMNPFDLIVQGIDLAAGSEGAVGWLLELEDRCLVLSGEPRDRLGLLGVGSEVFRFLDRFDEPTRIRDVLDAMSAHKLAGAQIARALMLAVHTGYLSLTDPV